MATIYDVAKEAGVSTTTVSRVINADGRVSHKTRSRVLKAMEALKYEPSFLARALVTNRNHTVGLVIPDVCNPFYPPLIKGVGDALKAQGYRLIVCETGGDLDLELDYLSMLARREVDGIILYAHDMRSRWFSLAQNCPGPFVYMGSKVNHPRIETVDTDESFGAYEAVSYLIDRGHRRIAYLGGLDHFLANVRRFEAYKRALADGGIALDPRYVRNGDFTLESGQVCVENLLREDPRPTAVFACSDLMAAGALRAAHGARLKVPDDLAVVGFDDIPLAVVTYPPLTTVAQPKYELGRTAADCLVEYMRNPTSYKKKEIQLPTRLVRRDSA